MRPRTAAVLTALALLPLAGCSAASTTTAEVSYQIDERLTALTIAARAAGVEIVTADGPVTVIEKHRYSKGKPDTTHRVDGQTLRLIDAGCGDDKVRCEVHYAIRMPKAMSAEITADAGAVKVDGLAGNLRITTDAGAVEARRLTSAEVTVTTDAGAASVEFAAPPTLVRTTTSFGPVDVRVPDTTAYALDIDTSVGKTTVNVDEDPASKHHITVRTDVGPVTIAHLP
ncbi:DUF4097 family beta strand repeat-containing protein [Actinoplanes sp. NPDC051633]|uniref:DUF4097 family beta strand repeat-containing protein n=1 Tax=Actinoplanes sp. NPDC051633 TaxID=3155670 RepID=UPI00342A4BEE